MTHWEKLPHTGRSGEQSGIRVSAAPDPRQCLARGVVIGVAESLFDTPFWYAGHERTTGRRTTEDVAIGNGDE